MFTKNTNINKVNINLNKENLNKSYDFFEIKLPKEIKQSDNKKEISAIYSKVLNTIFIRNLQNNVAAISLVSRENEKYVLTMYQKDKVTSEKLLQDINCKYVQEIKDSEYFRIGISFNVEKKELKDICPCHVLKLFFYAFNKNNAPIFSVKTDARKEQKICLKIDLNEDVVSLNVNTFSCLIGNEKTSGGKYRIQYKENLAYESEKSLLKLTGMQLTENNDNVDINNKYVLHNDFKGTKNSIIFLGLPNCSQNEYFSSKFYYFSIFYKLFNERYCNYITFSLEELCEVDVDKESIKYADKKEFKNHLIHICNEYGGLNIVDKTDEENNEHSKMLEQRIVDMIGYGKLKISISNEVRKNMFNLVIIHEVDFYKNDKAQDPYAFYSEEPVNHVVLEKILKIKKINKHKIIKTMDGFNSSILFSVLKELLIKKRIIEKEIDIKEFIPIENKCIYFSDDIYFSGISSYGTIYSIKISPDKNMEFDVDCPDSNKILQQIINIEDKSYYGNYYCIFYQGKTALIELTNLFSLGHFELIDKAVNQYEYDLSNIEIKKSKVYALAVKTDSKKWLSSHLDWQDNSNIVKMSETDCTSQKNKMLYISCSNYIFEKNNKWIKSFKMEDTRETLLYGLCNICSYNINDKTVLFWVGKENNPEKTTIQKASPIRKITFSEYDDVFKKIILDMLKCEFVRWGRQTTIPFPCKILREAFAVEYAQKY